MQLIAAEEIRDFDTSLDRLWARRDLVVAAAGALICFRSIYRRALQIGALGRFRYAAVRAEDYVLGTAEEAIREAVRDAARLPGARAVVIYLSCLDILTRPDFADIERTLSAETGCIVRCFFRGPLAKADGIRHETAEELLAALPPEEGAVTAPAQLPPPMSDTAGVADFLRADGAAHVLVTPSGCRNALARMDLMPERSDVYALIPQAEDYIFGMEETSAAAIDRLLRAYGFRNIHCAAYAWDEETAVLYRQESEANLLIFRTAVELQPAWDAADAVIADPALLSAMGEKRLVPLPSGLLSGRNAAGEGSGVLGADFAAVLDAFLKG